MLTQAQKFFATAQSPSPRSVVAIFALYVIFLFALNVLHAYQLGFQSKMYDNPIYRWRESLVIACLLLAVGLAASFLIKRVAAPRA